MITGDFQQIIWDEGRKLYRDMPWRTSPTPYHVWVSELMLQQTQVVRVIPKFEEFMLRFPSIVHLARSPLSDVLGAWSGLGYNRRAKFLWQAAGYMKENTDSQLPSHYDGLTMLPGIGANTAAAIMNYAYQIPVPYVETNIRTVYFHHFFHDQTNIADRELRILVERTMDREHPREWFWALMDYGSYLKSTTGGKLNMSRHYKKQTPLAGSLREMRGRIVRELTLQPLSMAALKDAVMADERFEKALADLIAEDMINRQHTLLKLGSSKG